MGLSIRVIVEHPSRGLVRFPFQHFRGVYDGKRPIPEFAQKKVRYAMGYVNTINRMPYQIRHIDYSIFKFNDAGLRDPKDHDIQMRLAVNSVSYGFEEDPKGASLAAAISRGRRAELYRWEPTPTELFKIREIFLTR